jgi:hypothetical protein
VPSCRVLVVGARAVHTAQRASKLSAAGFNAALRDAAIHAPIAIAGNNVSPVQARRSLCRGAINQSHRDKKSAAAYDAQNGNLSDSKAGE